MALPSSCSIGMGWRLNCQKCRSLLLCLASWLKRTMCMARSQRRNQPVLHSGRHGPFSTHLQRIALGSMQCCCWEGAAAVICLFRLCRFCCGRQLRRQLVKWGSGDPGARMGATLLVIIYPWARRCLKGAHVGLPCWFSNFLGEGLCHFAWAVAVRAGPCPCKTAMHDSMAQICGALKRRRQDAVQMRRAARTDK